jgi:hypothetical protein
MNHPEAKPQGIDIGISGRFVIEANFRVAGPRGNEPGGSPETVDLENRTIDF